MVGKIETQFESMKRELREIDVKVGERMSLDVKILEDQVLSFPRSQEAAYFKPLVAVEMTKEQRFKFVMGTEPMD